MSDPRKKWLLKVVAGPNAGAELELRAGRVAIGSDPQCDVVLQDVLIAPQHVALEFAESGVSAAPLGGRVFIGGRRVKESRAPLPDFAFLTLGGSHLVVGPADQPWPLLSAADIPELEKEAPEPPPAPPADEPEPTPAEPVAAAAPPAPAPAPVMEDPVQRKRRAMAGITAGVVLLVVWLFAWQMWAPQPPVSAQAPEPRVEAEEVLTKLGVSGNVRIEEQANRLFAYGYVNTDATQREVLAALREQAPNVIPRIWSMERITATARGLLAGRGVPVDIEPLSDGKLRVTGTVPNPDVWSGARRMLVTEVPGLAGLDENVRTPQISQPVLRPQPAPAPAPTTAAVIPPPDFQIPEPVAPPVVPAKPEQKPSSVLDTPESVVLDIRRRTDGMSWVRLNTGGIYFKGGELPSGGTIADITDSGIVVEESGHRRIIKPGERVWSGNVATDTAQQ